MISCKDCKEKYYACDKPLEKGICQFYEHKDCDFLEEEDCKECLYYDKKKRHCGHNGNPIYHQVEIIEIEF